MKEYNKKPKSQPHAVASPVPVALQGLGENGGGSEANPLPCLYSNNSIETTNFEHTEHALRVAELLTNYHRKQAHTLTFNVQRLIDQAPTPGHVGFLTLTFPDKVTDYKEASKRFDSFNTNYLSKSSHFGHWVRVPEQHKNGVWHFHLLIQLSKDIKTGLDFDALAKRNYRSASPYLRSLWAELRENLPKYQFGRSELLPIRKNAEAMAFYVGKYIGKHISQRDENSKGIRFTSYSKGFLRCSPKLSWYNLQSMQWRWNVATFADLMGLSTHDALSDRFGPRWAYKYREEIINIQATIKASNEDIPF